MLEMTNNNEKGGYPLFILERKNMGAKDVWDTVNKIDGKEMDKGTRAVLEALVKDGEEMSKRMTSLESKVDKVDRNIEDLGKKIDDSLNQKQNFWKFLSELIKEQKFWIFITILALLIFGVSITDLKGIFGG